MNHHHVKQLLLILTYTYFEKAEGERRAAEEEAALQKQIAEKAKATKVSLLCESFLIYIILCISSMYTILRNTICNTTM